MNKYLTSKSIVVGGALLLATLPVMPRAQDFPARPIRLIVGFVPGGVADLLARALAQKITDAWGQQVIVDNRPGGGGVISMQIVGKAAPVARPMLEPDTVSSNGLYRANSSATLAS